MLWAKCGKILTDDSGKIVNCPSNPCVFPAQVKDSKIEWNYMSTICITVSQNLGLVAKKKAKSNCWEECVEWDQNWQNCIEYGQYCDFCGEIQVYNLAGCFDDYNKFAQFFYGKCGVSADGNGKYPQIFEQWYGSTYPTGSAYDCVQNYWKRYFCDLYMLNYKINIQCMNQYWILYSSYMEYSLETYCECFCALKKGTACAVPFLIVMDDVSISGCPSAAP